MNAAYVQEGKTLNYVNPTEEIINAGTVVVYGVICGVAATTILPGELGSIATTGAWEVAKDESEISGGAVVYYDEESDVATTTKKNVVLGYAIADAPEDATSVIVKFNGCPVVSAG